MFAFRWRANISFGTRSGNRTRTAVAGHRILSPACLPIPPSEQPYCALLRVQKYRFYFENASYSFCALFVITKLFTKFVKILS